MKKIYSLIISLIIVLSFPLNSFGNDKIQMPKYEIKKEINYEKNNLKVFGSYPLISNLKDKNFEKIINQEIGNIINSLNYIKKENSMKKVEVSYEIISSGDILSVIIYFKNLSTSEINVKTIVFDINKKQILSINKILGANGLSFVNKVVTSKASELNITPKEVSKTTPFYVQNKNIIVIFGAGELTFVQRGNIKFEINTNYIKNYKVNKNSYYKKSQYNVKMIPLRKPLEYFGYEINWDSNLNTITITKDKVFLSYVKLGQNKYSKGNKFLRHLEFPPENFNGETYVPISFFSEILDFIYGVDENQNIIISSYNI